MNPNELSGSGPPSPVAVTGIAAAVALILTGVIRRLAIAQAVLDVPNARSLHQQPTPRGGGLAIAVVLIGAVGWLGFTGGLSNGVVTGLLGGMSLIAVIGWIDDVRGLSNWLRMIVQAVAAVWFLAWTDGLPTLRAGGGALELGWFGGAIALVGIVWSINLYNFMDGIDGIAGGQGVVAAVFGTALLAGVAPGLSLLCAALGGACLGFLAWNWSPARIFMGDAGSGLLGFMFAALAILSEQSGGPPLASWLFFGGVFIFDATVTLVRRFLHGERWYAAHRSHAYQRAVQSGWSHGRVAFGVIVLAVILGSLGALVAAKAGLLVVLGSAGILLLLLCYLWVEWRMPMKLSTGSSPPVIR